MECLDLLLWGAFIFATFLLFCQCGKAISKMTGGNAMSTLGEFYGSSGAVDSERMHNKNSFVTGEAIFGDIPISRFGGGKAMADIGQFYPESFTGGHIRHGNFNQVLNSLYGH